MICRALTFLSLTSTCNKIRHDSQSLSYLVAHKHNRDILADSGQILVPLGDVFIGDSGADVEHYDGTLSSNAER